MSLINKKSSFKKAFAIIFIIDNIGRIVNFAKNIIITSVLGFTRITDAFNYANAISGATVGLLSGALLSGIIPFMNKKKTDSERIDFLYSLCFIITFILSFVALIVYFSVENIDGIIMPGFSPENVKLTKTIIVFILPTLILKINAEIFEGYYRSKMIFGFTNLTNLFSAILVAVSFVCFLRNDYMVIVKAPLYIAVSVLLLYFFVSSKKVPKFDADVFRLLIFSLPLVVGSTLGILNSFVDRGFASLLPAGQLSLISYADLIRVQAQAVLTTPIIGAAFSFISKDIHDGKKESVQQRINKIVRSLVLAYSFLVIIFLIFGETLLSLIFFHGSVTSSDIVSLYRVTSFYFLILPFSSVASFMSTIYLSLKDVFRPSIISIFGLLVNILINNLLIERLGIYTLAISSLCSAIIHCTLNTLYLAYRHQIKSLSLRFFLNNILVVLVGISMILNHTFVFFNHGLLNLSFLLVWLVFLYFSKIVNKEMITSGIYKLLHSRK